MIFEAILEKVPLPGIAVFDKFSLGRRKKIEKSKINTYLDDEDSEFDVDGDVDTDNAIEMNEVAK